MNVAHPLHLPPRLALTPGEPAGIGPDLAVRIAQEPLAVDLVAVADPQLLAERAAALRLPLTLEPFDPDAPRQAHRPGTLRVLATPLYAPVRCGVLDRSNAIYVLDTLTLAAEGCLDGTFDALVTGPVHKGIINDAGVPFTGHTEFLQQLTGTQQVVMMLATAELKVALVTTHLPLSQVSAAITPKRLTLVLRVLHAALTEQFGLVDPRILVCGLNPHAGEGGHMGREEIEVMDPVLEQMRAEGMQLEGPVPADTAFTPPRLAAADAVLTLYHDQGLPVLKHLGFGRAVNITLGLPLIRTSVDHGTALDLAGTGRADTGSLMTALALAETMARNARLHA